jgi:hypothetical protein
MENASATVSAAPKILGFMTFSLLLVLPERIRHAVYSSISVSLSQWHETPFSPEKAGVLAILIYRCTQDNANP